MNTFEITGKYIKNLGIKEMSERFKKLEFIVEVEDRNRVKQTIKFQVINNKIKFLKDDYIGKTLRLAFNIKGLHRENKNTGKDEYINNLEVWDIECVGNQ